jgi:hypothetical protein
VSVRRARARLHGRWGLSFDQQQRRKRLLSLFEGTHASAFDRADILAAVIRLDEAEAFFWSLNHFTVPCVIWFFFQVRA